MNPVLVSPRSTLHALKPYGCGTPEVESLLSYFCRLAVSHSVALSSLARIVVDSVGHELREGFDWHERNLSGIGESARTWASGISALTGVGQLDQLTLTPWENVMARCNLAAPRDRWCPQCLAEDREEGRTPYFRLAWDIGAVNVCHRHRTPLVEHCPDCGRRGIRHKASYVVPGWCTHCGGFLGQATPPDLYSAEAVESITPEALWMSRQVGMLLSAQANLMNPPTREGMHEAIRTLVTRLDHGKSAVFARRIGLGKATVHNWLQSGGIPTLSACLLMSLHTGLALPKLLMGDLEGWESPQEPVQLDLNLVREGKPRETPRCLDWEFIRAELLRYAAQPTPLSLAEAARRLDVDTRHLYLQANKEARILGEKWKRYVKLRGEATHNKARPYIEAACYALLEEGKGLSLRNIEERVPPEILNSVERLFDMVREIQEELRRTQTESPRIS